MNNMRVLINSYKKNLKLKVQQLWIKLLSSIFLMQLSNLSPYHPLALPTLTRVRSAFPLSRVPTLAILSLQCKRKTVSAGHSPCWATLHRHTARLPRATWGQPPRLSALTTWSNSALGEQLGTLPPCQPGEPPRGIPELRAASARAVPAQSQLWGALGRPKPFGAAPGATNSIPTSLRLPGAWSHHLLGHPTWLDLSCPPASLPPLFPGQQQD